MYAVIKSLHILAVVIFLGNVITGLFWKSHGDRTGDARNMAHTISGIIRSDRLFTVPGVVAIIVFGLWTAINGKYPILGTSWIRHSIILFSVSGVVFMARVAPLQRQLLVLAGAGASGNWDEGRYRKLSRPWEIWGAIAILTPLAALALMVVKPGS